MPRPKNVVKAGWHLHSTLWGHSRTDRPTAVILWMRLLQISQKLPMSRGARKRLRWFYDSAVTFKGNVRKTCRYHGIPPKTFYFWKKRFDFDNPRSLEERSHRPKNPQRPAMNTVQLHRILDLRSKYMTYSKFKIAVLYEQMYREKISSWQIQRVIERYKLYPDIKRARRIAGKRRWGPKKKRILGCTLEPWTGWMFSIDSVLVYIGGQRKCIFTAIDRHSRLLFTRVYHKHNSHAASDFLEQLVDFADNRVQNIHTDNGTEFCDSFERTAKRLGLTHWWSRTYTPKDNAMNERVNRTIREEFLPPYKYCDDFDFFSAELLGWMNEYNRNRPHASLGYKTPWEVAMAHPNPKPRFFDMADFA